MTAAVPPALDHSEKQPTNDAGAARWRKLVALVLGLTVVVVAMLVAFALPSVHGGPHNMKLGVTGPAPALDALEGTLDQDQWDILRFDTPESIADAVIGREVAGGLAITPHGIEVYTASAGGAGGAGAVTAIGTAVAGQQQLPVRVDDVVPFPDDDPRGAGLTAAALPLVFGGLIPAIALTQLFPGRTNAALRVVGVVAFAVVAAFAITAVLQFGLGSLAGNYWLTGAGLALGMAALSLTVLGLEALIGLPGIGIGAVTMMFVGNPLSGLPTGGNWLPNGWSTLGQLLPPGATGSLLRANAFFDGIGAGFPVTVLGCWVIFGLVLVAVASRREPAVK